jgi:hypothetical protein
MSVQIDGEGTSPLGERQFLKRTRRPGDAGVIDEDVEAVEVLFDVRKQRVNLRLVRHVGANAEVLAPHNQYASFENSSVDVADHAARAYFDHTLCYDQADARGTRGH